MKLPGILKSLRMRYAQYVSKKREDFENELVKECFREFKTIFYGENSEALLKENREAGRRLLERHRLLENAIDSLDDELKAPVKLSLQGYTNKQIAAELRTDVRTVKKRIRAARAELRKKREHTTEL